MSQTEGERWIKAGENDWLAAQSLLTNGYFHLCAFHAQQAAEKGLKGALRLAGRVAWGHSCLDLLTQLNSLLPNSVPTDLLDAARRLDGHYIPARYPDAFPQGIPAEHYKKEMAVQALEDAQKILYFVKP